MAFISKKDRDLLKNELAYIDRKVKLVFFTQQFECQFCKQTHELLEEVLQLSGKIKLEVYDFQKDTEKVKQYSIDKIPAFVVEGTKDYSVRYFGIPSG